MTECQTQEDYLWDAQSVQNLEPIDTQDPGHAEETKPHGASGVHTCVPSKLSSMSKNLDSLMRKSLSMKSLSMLLLDIL